MNSEGHFVNEAGTAMAEAVTERTGGAVTIEMFPSGQLGENSQITEQITLGGDLIGQVGPGTIANYVPDFGVMVYPFMYADYSDAERLLGSDLWAGIEAQAEEQHNIKVLCYFAFGIRDLYTRETPVAVPEDMSGLRMRVQPVTIYTEMVRQVFDAAPTPMPWPEVYSAFAQGVIAAGEAPPAAILDQRHHEHANYLIQTNHILDLSPIVMSASLYNGLSEENQMIVQEEADNACAIMTDTALSGYQAGIDELESLGMTIISDIDLSLFAARAGGMPRASRSGPTVSLMLHARLSKPSKLNYSCGAGNLPAPHVYICSL
ncbi:TRAP transporter substrate-binding protein DctP [Rhodophyticola sp. CCM32]|uniref:TRAP transporter substrate-binding protein DctP n=1 Tax=Rhodophyticola sp. CCM32 TaxID=2916397 RepID=UPI00143CD39C|nr:TRAP transporter substrate-binding protein DctP [Rhodophyticola sp. CCM32]